MFKRRIPLSSAERVRQFLWPRMGWWRTTVYMVQRLLRIRDGAHHISLGLAAGAFASAFPILGTHIIIAALLAWLIGGNVIAAALGTWAGNPLSFPLIWLGSYRVGNFVLGRDTGGVAPDFGWEFLRNAPWDYLLPMLIGAIPIGLLMAVPTYFIGVQLVTYYQNKRVMRRLLRRKKKGAR